MSAFAFWLGVLFCIRLLILCRPDWLRLVVILAHLPTHQDPSVMGASLCALHEVIKQKPEAYKNLTASFVSILKQVSPLMPPSYASFGLPLHLFLSAAPHIRTRCPGPSQSAQPLVARAIHETLRHLVLCLRRYCSLAGGGAPPAKDL